MIKISWGFIQSEQSNLCRVCNSDDFINNETNLCRSCYARFFKYKRSAIKERLLKDPLQIEYDKISDETQNILLDAEKKAGKDYYPGANSVNFIKEFNPDKADRFKELDLRRDEINLILEKMEKELQEDEYETQFYLTEWLIHCLSNLPSWLTERRKILKTQIPIELRDEYQTYN